MIYQSVNRLTTGWTAGAQIPVRVLGVATIKIHTAKSCFVQLKYGRYGNKKSHKWKGIILS
jgi:hypothetical protein